MTERLKWSIRSSQSGDQSNKGRVGKKRRKIEQETGEADGSGMSTELIQDVRGAVSARG